MTGSKTYYNEIDRFKAAWLRELIRENLIAAGEVDEQSVEEVKPQDLAGFTQCHFFAGIGAWSHALRLARWPDNRPVWTGSCPCPSFSVAGKGAGFNDPRHLWPAWFGLIRECRPPTLFGEQVDGAIGYGWLDLVQSDLEGETYAVGKAVLGACSVGAPHIRNRLWFVAESAGFRHNRGQIRDGDGEGHVRTSHSRAEWWSPGESAREGETGLLADTESTERRAEHREHGDTHWRAGLGGSGPTNGFWRDAEWVWCRDGKSRPVEPGSPPLAHGTPARLVRLRGYGDAIVAPVAEAFIRAYLEVKDHAA